LACTDRRRAGGDKGITRKYRNLEAPRARGRFWLLRKGNTMRREHRNNAPATAAVGRRHARV